MAATIEIPRTGLLVRRDYEIANWIDRVGAASVEQVRQRFGLGRSQAYGRLRVLVGAGILTRQRLTSEIPLLWLPVGGSVGLSRIEHLFQVSGLVASREVVGVEIATERELRRTRVNRDNAPRAIRDQVDLVCACERMPDAVERSAAGGLTAYELELSSKGRDRRARIFNAYALSGYERVSWIAPSPQIASLLRREIEDSGLTQFMDVADALPS